MLLSCFRMHPTKLSMGGGDVMKESKTKCVPFVSQYSNCNDDNMCTGCTSCKCNADGEWACEDIKDCGDKPPTTDDTGLDGGDLADEADEIFDNALQMLELEIEKKKLNNKMYPKKQNSDVGRAPKPEDSRAYNNKIENKAYKQYDMEDIVSMMMRTKRSAPKSNRHKRKSADKVSSKHVKNLTASSNKTIKFFDTVDELNEDTLKSSNLTGTLTAQKMDIVPKIVSRRSGDAENTSKALQIEYNQPKPFNQITDNKIDTMEHENKFDASHESLKFLLGNHSQAIKDQNLSKIVVNELKNGSEIIGDATAPVTSNITFTPENDTLTAMAFIAGNLLNKLWSMEKDATGSSMETDVIKHQKIADLLDLFKEPLNLRQEMFLKNALEQLSTAIEKDKSVKNISICERIEEAKKIIFNTSASEEDESKVVTTVRSNNIEAKYEDGKQKAAAVSAITKINNVLDLIRKFENIQGNLSDLRHGPKLNFNLSTSILPEKTSKSKLVTEPTLTQEEKKSLNVFGNIVEKITRFLMPNRNNKKILKQMKSINGLGNHENLKKNFKKLYNIDLTNMTVTAKDKLILDYLTHIDGNPDCLLKKNKKKPSETLSNIEGNILLNLSEFFKMKSFGDLIKLLNPDKTELIRSSVSTTTEIANTRKKLIKKVYNTTEVQDADSNKFNSTKEKLKTHLKTIIEDLVELQKANGGNVKGNLRIADALPCIYNILNAGKEQISTKNNKEISPIKEVEKMFKDLKKEIKLAKTRRTNINIKEEKPKSAAIWARIIKNLNEKSNSQNRRRMNAKVPKSYNEIKQLIEKLENSSSTYKRYALKGEVPATGRLMMLRTLELDVLTSMNVLGEIQLAFDNLSKLSPRKIKELTEFVTNIAASMNIDEKISTKLKEPPKQEFVDEITLSKKIIKPKIKPLQTRAEIVSNDELKVSRNQIVNQLIRNRVQLYLKMKEDKEFGVHDDMNYNIAKRILYYLDAGNQDLAKELFKVFVMQKNNNVPFSLSSENTNDKYIPTSTPKMNEFPLPYSINQPKVPLLQFDNPNDGLNKQVNWVDQDHLIKQLLKFKNMGAS